MFPLFLDRSILRSLSRLSICAALCVHGVLRAQSPGFEENLGQGPEWAQWLASGPSFKAAFGQNRIGLRLIDPETSHLLYPHGHSYHAEDQVYARPSKAEVFPLCDVFVQVYRGREVSPEAMGEALPGAIHHHTKAKSISNVRAFPSIAYKDVLPGIDWRVEQPVKEGSMLKHSFVLSPGAEPDSILLYYEGAESIEIKNGELILQTSCGTLAEDAPYAYQNVDGRQIQVQCAFALRNGMLGYDLGPYDRTRALIIDPNVVFSSYSGSTSDNWGFTATQDPAGNMYLGGIVFGAGFPVSPGAHDTVFSGNSDIAIIKLSPDGQTRIYASYLGGSANDRPYSFLATQDGLYLMGITGSSNFPTSPNAFDTSFAGGPPVQVIGGNYTGGADMFVSHLSPDGSSILASTLIGGTGNEGINRFLSNSYGDESRGEINLDTLGNVYVISTAESADFPLAGAASSFAGQSDAVVYKLTPDLDTLLWSRYLGGSSADAGFSIALSDSGRVYVCGATASSDFPTTAASAHPAYLGGSSDGYLARLDSETGALVYGSFIGSAGRDLCYFVDTDIFDQVSTVGHTDGALAQSPGLYGQPNGKQFVQLYPPALDQALRSLRFGSGRAVFDISPSAFRIDSCGSAYISGWGGGLAASGCSTQGLYVSPDAFQSTTDGSDFYFLVLDPIWENATYATYFGGNGVAEHVDGGTSRFDRAGVITQAICAGCGGSSNTPAFPPGVWSPTNNSPNCNMLGVRIDLKVDSTFLDIFASRDTLCTGDTLLLGATAYQLNRFEWDLGDGRSSSNTSLSVVYNTPGTYAIKLEARRGDCVASRSDSVLVYVLEAEAADVELTVDYDSCGTDYAVNFDLLGDVRSATLYTGVGGVLSSFPIAYPYPGPGTYRAWVEYISGRCGYIGRDSVEIRFGGLRSTSDFAIDYLACRDGLTVSLTTAFAGASFFTLDFGDGQQQTGSGTNWQHTYNQSGTYTIRAILTDTLCNQSDTAVQTLVVGGLSAEPARLPNVFSPNGDFLNDIFSLQDYAISIGADRALLQVYNRWGQQMYIGDPAWDGLHDGQISAEGVYFWILELSDPCGNESTRQGIVHLQR